MDFMNSVRSCVEWIDGSNKHAMLPKVVADSRCCKSSTGASSLLVGSDSRSSAMFGPGVGVAGISCRLDELRHLISFVILSCMGWVDGSCVPAMLSILKVIADSRCRETQLGPLISCRLDELRHLISFVILSCMEWIDGQSMPRDPTGPPS